MNRSAAVPNQYEGGGAKTVSMFSKLVSQGSSFVMEGVKNLVVKRHVRITVLYFIGIGIIYYLLLYRICQ